ncbi:hypothetical protein J4H86_06820 [Spiractinospora alimapuensis]|uniref:hypothetical protein n=1 Tax=Spiractinospora alimapuensis TaxID=2820884 RepID=UPI001F1FFF10|nr:hypothetical protein [Spiractinospora alimapuensis]QVQ53462.1 hypothetical protein J4H86_06820 [Spiractinospora alimapuensis]
MEDESTRRGPRRPLRLTAPQAKFLRQVWEYLATTRPGADADARLLALVCLLRAARTGVANVTSQDVRSLRVADPETTVSALTETGWLKTTPSAVLNSDAQTPAVCGLPEFVDNPWDVGAKVRTRVSGWSTGTLAHKALRKKSNGTRLAALYLTTYAAPGGGVDFTANHLIAACALDGVDELVSCLGELVTKGWLSDLPTVTATGVSAQLGEAVAPMAPEPPEEPSRPTEPRPVTADLTWPELDAVESVDERAKILVAGRESAVAEWVQAFRAEHHHGPNWAAVMAAHDWPPHSHPHGRAAETAFVLLAEEGWLDGLGRPYGLRPGARFAAGSGTDG